MLDINSVQFLVQARKRGADFGETLMIGRQNLNVFPAKMRAVLEAAGYSSALFAPEVKDTGYAEPVFLSLGARRVSSMDASGFEGAEFVHDLNKPVGPELKGRFDLVYDGGTLEHVFNFPTALANCMEMLRPGGRFITHTCANNWCGHGFYQFSPELFYSAMSEENGFEVERVVVHVVGPYGRWFEVADPQVIRSRIELFNSFPLQMLVEARRKAVVPLFQSAPQQGDYTQRWTGQGPEADKTYETPRSKLAHALPGVARLTNAMKIGWQMWRGHSLSNRRAFRPVPKK